MRGLWSSPEKRFAPLMAARSPPDPARWLEGNHSLISLEDPGPNSPLRPWTTRKKQKNRFRTMICTLRDLLHLPLVPRTRYQQAFGMGMPLPEVVPTKRRGPPPARQEFLGQTSDAALKGESTEDRVARSPQDLGEAGSSMILGIATDQNPASFVWKGLVTQVAQFAGLSSTELDREPIVLRYKASHAYSTTSS